VAASAPAVPSRGGRSWPLLTLAFAALAAALFFLRPPMRSATGPPAPSPSGSTATLQLEAAPPPLMGPVPVAPPLPEVLPEPASTLPDADAETLVLLGGKVQARVRISDSDLESGEVLLRRYPGEPAAKALVEALLIAVGSQDRLGRRPAQAAARFRRLVELRPQVVGAHSALVTVLLEASDWPGAEAAARDLLALDPRHPEGLRALGFALMRQDRAPEALEALRSSLEARDDPATRELFERVQKSLMDERGMTEQRLAHFNVRYDGEAHDDVGREILRALERHHATLSRTFDHQPAATVPVVLYSEQSYFDATGAPFWSGGQYSHFDGRITIPIGGLSSALTPSLDHVLVHEVTHAFVHDLSRGIAPRDLHEGLAQYSEGKRVEAELGSPGMTALAEGRMPEVMGFYFASLAFVEQLMAERGQGGVNDVLRRMGETGSVDEAFRRVYGHSHEDAARAWGDRIRLQHAR